MQKSLRLKEQVLEHLISEIGGERQRLLLDYAQEKNRSDVGKVRSEFEVLGQDASKACAKSMRRASQSHARSFDDRAVPNGWGVPCTGCSGCRVMQAPTGKRGHAERT